MRIKELDDGSLLIEERSWGLTLIIIVILIICLLGTLITSIIQRKIEPILLVLIVILGFLIVIANKIYQQRELIVKFDLQTADITYYHRRNLLGVVKYPLNSIKFTAFDPETRKFYLILKPNVQLFLLETTYVGKSGFQDSNTNYYRPILIRSYQKSIHAWLKKHGLGSFQEPKMAKSPDPDIERTSTIARKRLPRGE